MNLFELRFVREPKLFRSHKPVIPGKDLVLTRDRDEIDYLVQDSILFDITQKISIRTSSHSVRVPWIARAASVMNQESGFADEVVVVLIDG